LRGQPAVFNNQRRPWIDPSQSPAGEIAAVIHRCPSGALHYQRKDGGRAEVADEHVTISVQRDGPLYVRGQVQIKTSDGRFEIQDVRMALCRCGHSNNKPFCDNTHFRINFSDPGLLQEELPEVLFEDEQGLEILAESNGPLRLSGVFAIYDSNGRLRFRGRRASLCRCGGSARKPFCDDTHLTNGFTTE
jgi:CDGSH-type Zn-finger protein